MREYAAGFDGTLSPGGRPALLAVDLMRAYFDSQSSLCLPSDDCLAVAANLIEVARDCGVPVVHTRVSFGPDGMDGGMFVRKVPALRTLIGSGEMTEFMSQVAPTANELIVVKQYASAFFGTTLASTLRFRGVDTVVIVGVSTSGCVRATAVDAIQHGFVPLVVRQGVADRDLAPHQASLYDLQAKYAEVVDAEAAASYFRSVV